MVYVFPHFLEETQCGLSYLRQEAPENMPDLYSLFIFLQISDQSKKNIPVVQGSMWSWSEGSNFSL